jgi:AP endonuclease-2
LNVSHKPIDTCDSGEDLNVSIYTISLTIEYFVLFKYFNSSPSRLWFSKLISEDIFIDTFRYLHPDQREAYTCWETLSNARVNNYGVRIDYIICDGIISKSHLINCQHRTEILSSDHCPVMAEFNYIFKDRSQEKPPSICTKFWPEFKGTQMKLSQFVVKTKRIREEEIDK